MAVSVCLCALGFVFCATLTWGTQWHQSLSKLSRTFPFKTLLVKKKILQISPWYKLCVLLCLPQV